ncbi:glycosyltransferase family 39 protein [Hydrococcus rivularis]|uniref:glycosyltransferase family 39 protein n=1 Tax=Hydrococcus rivularis TaxID=1616834 RepID=UPI0009F91AA3|nr:glycosyltransferase family 39 protein [Hydrococcus rivularis]
MEKSKVQQLLAESDRNSPYITQKKNYPLLRYISIFFLVFGIFVRLIQYVSNRSLWYDEASLALNIVNRSYLELLGPLDYDQAAPPGFLWIEKLFVQLLGNNEYVLRLFPLIVGIISIFAFYQFAQRYSSTLAAPIAIALFACLESTIYYATEVKQYGVDLMGTLILSLLLIPLRDRVFGKRQILFLSLVGAIFIWLSHPAIFVLSGIELSSWLSAPARKRQSIILNRLPIYLVWLLSFAVLFFLSINVSANNPRLQYSWGASYPDAPWDVVWLFDSFGRFFYTPLSFFSITDGIALFAFVCGCVAYYRTNRTNLLFLASPFLTTLLASYLHKYPFRDRLVFFLAPPTLLFIAEGVVFLLTRFQRRYKYVIILGIIVLIALVIPPSIRASQLVFTPEVKEETVPVLEYVKSHQQPGDMLYIHRGARSQFLYYAEKFGYREGDYILGGFLMPKKEDNREPWVRFTGDIEKLRGKERVWLVFRAKYKESKKFSSYLDRIGKQLDFFSQRIDSAIQPCMFVYLYDFSGSP